jgi:carbon monoxide dehydrogenase subunit G
MSEIGELQFKSAENRKIQLRRSEMASIHREVLINVSAEKVWMALSDVGALHTKLVPGFVTDCVFDGQARMVTFANGLSVRELIVDVDAAAMRVAWSAVGGTLTHHNASAQVVPSGGNTCRVVWVADLLPHEMAPAIAGMIEQGLRDMKRHLEATNAV